MAGRDGGRYKAPPEMLRTILLCAAYAVSGTGVGCALYARTELGYAAMRIATRIRPVVCGTKLGLAATLLLCGVQYWSRGYTVCGTEVGAIQCAVLR
eukprot:3090993-Rhodomonas_salina.1